MALPPDFIERIKRDVPIHEWIGKTVELKKSGREYLGLCPFHSEKTPSFTVYEDKFHCFGCSAGGDVIDFVKLTKDVSTADAISIIASEYGMELPNGKTHAFPTPVISAPREKPDDDWVSGIPPEGASAPEFRGFDKVYLYRDETGRVIRYVARKEARGDRSKIFTPYTWGTLKGLPGWHAKHPKVRSLYNLDQIVTRSKAPILIVEGEKAADAASKLFPEYIVSTWSAGSAVAAIRAADWSCLKGREVIIWPDNDQPGHKAAKVIEELLKGINCHALVIPTYDLPDKFDAADLVVDNPQEWLSDRIPQEVIKSKADVAWKNHLIRNDKDEPAGNIANILLVLRNDPKVQFIAARDLMERVMYVSAQIPGTALDKEFKKHPFRDCDITAVQEYLQRQGGLKYASFDSVHKALELRAFECQFHPIHEYLESLKWDGVERLNKWLSYYMGVENSPYTSEVGKLFLISMVARIYWPGCKCDYMLVFEGFQGDKKSQAAEVLANGWFSDHLPDIGHKDSSAHLNGKWLIEVAEMSAISKAESAALKAFITRSVEKYRPSHGRVEVVEPRQCVFIGSTNKKAYLRDETGGRRFWPVATGTIDIESLKHDRDQLFAEATCLYKHGHQWWPDRDFEVSHIKPQQEDRFEQDAWEDVISPFLEHKETTYMIEIAKDCLMMESQRIGTADQRRIINVLERLGWEKGKKRNLGVPYHKPKKVTQ